MRFEHSANSELIFTPSIQIGQIWEIETKKLSKTKTKFAANALALAYSLPISMNPETSRAAMFRPRKKFQVIDFLEPYQIE